MLLTKKQDITEAFRSHLEMAINSLLVTELTEFLDYEKYDRMSFNSGNPRNGSYSRTLHTEYGDLAIQIPRDRNVYNKYILNQDDSLYLKKEIEQFIDEEMKIEAPVIAIEPKVEFSVAINTLPLTIREKQVLLLVVEGLNNIEVAEKLSISIHTVKNHVTNIFRKLEVQDRIQLMAKVMQLHTNMER